MLFVRPEALSIGKGGADSSLQAKIKTVAFEGNMTHVYLDGTSGKDLVISLGRAQEAKLVPGSMTQLSFDPNAAIALPQGAMARE